MLSCPTAERGLAPLQQAARGRELGTVRTSDYHFNNTRHSSYVGPKAVLKLLRLFFFFCPESDTLTHSSPSVSKNNSTLVIRVLMCR